MASEISVIIPVYNVEAYLRRCLDSVVNQTFKNLEIICVDDGTKDNSVSILEEYAARDGRIRIFHKENGGLSSARNYGLKYATAPYIAFLDSDDWLELDALEISYRTMRESGADLIVFYAQIENLNIPKDDPCISDAANYHRIRREGLF
ncbi:MAG: glycosyltransferase, partial [Elusimicrobiota bacterium]|nr:glycosyltransferase [Elusimicrobiota bacterium]